MQVQHATLGTDTSHELYFIQCIYWLMFILLE